jgi:glutaredoxin/glutathione-dependent peroxiredoxin
LILVMSFECTQSKQQQGAHIVLLQADGNAELALAMGVELDLTNKGLGIRSRRYSMVLDDLEVLGHNSTCSLGCTLMHNNHVIPHRLQQ